MGTTPAAEDPTSGADPVRVNLLSGFELVIDGARVEVPVSAQRVVAYLALQARPRPRATVAGSLWLDVGEERAAANLRSALWKLRECRHRVVSSRANQLSLASQVDVDVTSVIRESRRLLDAERRAGPEAEATGGELGRERLELLSRDLLPGWDEEWIVFERERLRQLRLHAIEALSVQLRLESRYAEAIEVGLSAVAADPLRESAQRVLIEAFVAEGNVVDGRRQYEAFHRLLWRELGVEPSPELRVLVGLGVDPRQAGAAPLPTSASRPGAGSTSESNPSRWR